MLNPLNPVVAGSTSCDKNYIFAFNTL